MFKNNHKRIFKELREHSSKNIDIPKNPFEIWSTNYDIRSLNKIVNKYLLEKIEKVPQYQEKINEIREQIVDTATRVRRLTLADQIKELETKIEKLRNSPEEYKKMADSFLNDYLNVSDDDQRAIIVEEFLKMVQKFYPHRIVRDSQHIKPDHCLQCDVPLNDSGDILHCPQCFREYEEGIDLRSLNVKTKTHNPISYFEKTIDRMEEKEYIKIPESYLKLLDNIAKNRGMKKPFTRAQVIELIYSAGNSDYYDHISQVALQYADIPLPDYSSKRADLLDRYRQFCEIYPLIPKTLVSSLNGMFVLFKLLEIDDDTLDLKDFKAPISDQTLSKYDEIWGKACEILNWRYIRTKN